MSDIFIVTEIWVKGKIYILIGTLLGSNVLLTLRTGTDSELLLGSNVLLTLRTGTGSELLLGSNVLLTLRTGTDSEL
jgi:hypothetical protein